MNLAQFASRIPELPLLNLLSPSVDRVPTDEELAGYRACQQLARDAVREVASLVQEGWTEAQAADLLGTWLRDHGVRAFFHHPFAWFGERTRFDGIVGYRAFSPVSDRVLLPGEIFILDVAPIHLGYTCDIGYTSSLGPNEELDRAKKVLREIRDKIPALFLGPASGAEIWNLVEKWILDAGYDNIHKLYPFSVLGHRIHRARGAAGQLQFLNFGWHSFWSLASRGLFGQLLSPTFEGGKQGLWAVEPHLGGPGFGAKFEEILVVGANEARWLDEAFI